LPPPEIADPPSREAARQQLNLPTDKRIALFLGLIRPYKGVDLLIEAMARQSADSHWLLVVAGEPWGDLGPAIEEQVKNLAGRERVLTRLAWLPETEVPRYLGAADLVVLPYRSGSQSAVAPLALAAGSTRVGGLPEVVHDGVNGVLVEPGSVDELARALEDLDDKKLEELAAGARQSRARLTWDGYAAELVELLESVVSSKKVPGSQ
jgi:glycosyltransferase involved in cell wall biosynthesis